MSGWSAPPGPWVPWWTGGLALALLGSGLGLVGRDLYLGIKREMAEVRIEQTLVRHLADGGNHRPWPWADLYPVARLRAPRLGIRRAVLSGATGGTLAFGIGHVDGTPPPGHEGNVVLAGHRDGALGFLRDVRIGDELVIDTPDGTSAYRIDRIDIVPETATEYLEPGGPNRLTLITCYPFGALRGGSRRYVVSGRRVALSASARAAS